MIKECEINGSSDSSIKNIKINDIKIIIDNSKTNYIFCEGKLAYYLFQKYYSNLNIDYYYLPGTSSTNAKKN